MGKVSKKVKIGQTRRNVEIRLVVHLKKVESAGKRE